MKTNSLPSDQLYNWSVKTINRYARKRSFKAFRQRSAHSTPQAPGAIACVEPASAGFDHRTLQALWQSELPLSTRPRPWPEVLSFSQLSQKSPCDDLLARALPRNRKAVVGTLRASGRRTQRSLRHQPGVAAPSRTVRRRTLSSINACAHEAMHPNSPACDHAPGTSGRCAGGGRCSRQDARRFPLRLRFFSRFNRPAQ
jgi:hypothetical protein